MDSIQLLPVTELRPHERVILPRALALFTKMAWDQMFLKPILVDQHTKVILDGHHRWWASRKLGLQFIPCYCIDYLNDARISCEPRREDIPVTKETLIATAVTGAVFPPKTTKHRYELPTHSNFSFKELRASS